MLDIKEALSARLSGDVVTDAKTLEEYSRDTSLFVVRPQVVVFPKNVSDVQEVVRFINENKAEYQGLSVAGRSAGTCMSGGSLTESIMMTFTRYFNHSTVHPEELWAEVGPGVYYRNFEKETLPTHTYMPAYPASKSIAALGGMIMNNSGGEKTLTYGQMKDFVLEASCVLSDGNEYTFKKLTIPELEEKKKLDTFEGRVYRDMYQLLDENYEKVKAAKPRVAKNSSGYFLWDVYDKERGTFDLTQLFSGSQGTLGILTKAKVRLVKDKPCKKMVVLFFDDWDELPDVVNAVLPHKPESLEAFDDETLKLGLRFMPGIAKKVGKNLLSFAIQFLPEAWIGLKMLGLPKLIVLVEIVEDTKEEASAKVLAVEEAIKPFKIHHRVVNNPKDAEKYWVMRRESFALLRKHVSGKKTAPFIDDFCVLPERIPEFLPQMLAILKNHGIKANIAGHAGSGNFHIIPLMDLTLESERAKIPIVSDKVYDLIIKYEGTITAEHNDGIIRTPYLKKMYGNEVYALFERTKEIFDPKNIFNPGKKVGGTLEYMKSHIATK